MTTETVEAWWLEPISAGDAPWMQARKRAAAAQTCAYARDAEGTKLCASPALPDELYCDEHIQRVMRRTNRAGEIMPDDHRAPWNDMLAASFRRTDATDDEAREEVRAALKFQLDHP